MRSYAKHLGALSCDSCGVERDGAPDKADWLVTVRLGVLAETTCPRCAGAYGNRPSRGLDPVPGSTSEGPVELEITDHCVERWRERVRPGLTLEQAEDDLAHQLSTNARWGDRPDWLDDRYKDADWLLLGDGIALPTIGGRVLTAFVRATYNPYARRHTTNWNKFDRRVRRAKERPNRRKYLGREEKRRKQDRRSWREEA